jgi:hypothetical protein
MKYITQKPDLVVSASLLLLYTGHRFQLTRQYSFLITLAPTFDVQEA